MFKPTYTSELEGDMFKVTIHPPKMFGIPSTSLRLTAEQHDRFQAWLGNGELIQNVFPEWTPATREILLTGITPDGWVETFGKGS